MMSAQMLATASNASGTVADLAPGAKDGMRMLEAKAAEMAVDAPGSYVRTYFGIGLDCLVRHCGFSEY